MSMSGDLSVSGADDRCVLSLCGEWCLDLVTGVCVWFWYLDSV